MKLLNTLLFGKPAKKEKPKEEKKEKRSLWETLLDKLVFYLMGALEKKWNDSLWKQD